ncbi:hypothetical protein ACU5EH_24985 [Aliivibrio salmonicida]|uniref:hypothetical protein n=1 Tax=Aliivibrio salmonicida TaxID=40269 RepID=UPI00406BF3E5
MLNLKSLSKRTQSEWEKTLAVSKNATESEIDEAKAIYLDIDKQHPVKRSEAFSLALYRIYHTKGEVLGALVMIEFVQAMKEQQRGNSLLIKELKN